MRSRQYSNWWVLLFATLPLLGWWSTGLFDLDEGFYGAVVSEMNRRGEWITPYYNGQPWFEKPILLYWLAKPCVALFGPMVGARLPSVLCTLGLFLSLGWFAKRNYGEKAQTYAIFCAGSSLLILALGRLMMTDAPLTLALTLALFTFWESLKGQSLGGEVKWRYVTAFCLGIGVLAKGPVALLLFVPIAGLTYWRQPELRPKFRGGWLVGTLILIATIATWYVPAYMVNGQTFVQKFLIEQNIGRFTGGDAAHTLGLQGLPIYIPIILIALFPIGWLEWRFLTKENINDPTARFLFTWAMTIFVFFSISGAKLPHYVLPVIPPLIVLLAKRLQEKPRWHWSSPILPLCFGIFFATMLNAAQTAWYKKSGQAAAHELARKYPEIGGLYQLSRRQKDRGTGSTKLQETSLPSLIMVLNHPVVDTDELSDLRKPGMTFLTRVNRLSPREQQGLLLLDKNEFFEVWDVVP